MHQKNNTDQKTYRRSKTGNRQNIFHTVFSFHPMRALERPSDLRLALEPEQE
jgi:hypothetical protein